MKDFERFKKEKHAIEYRIAKLIENFCEEYDVELKNIDYDTYRLYWNQKNKTVKIKLDFDI